MSYLVIMASSSINEVLNFQSDITHKMKASKIVHVSHYLACGSTTYFFSKLLREIIDGGNVLTEKITHPMSRVPQWHSPDVVKILQDKYCKALEKVSVETDYLQIPESERLDYEKVLEILNHASKNNEAIVSFLDLNNFDIERKRRIKFQIELITI